MQEKDSSAKIFLNFINFLFERKKKLVVGQSNYRLWNFLLLKDVL